MEPKKNIQNPHALSRGYAMSLAPIMRGMRKFPKPVMMGMPTMKTMVVPCMVKRRLKVSGTIASFSAKKSWYRIRDASIPAIRKKMIPQLMYITPSFL